MLYERWRQIAHARANQVALRDLAAGKGWSFSELFEEAERRPLASGPVAYPQGHSAEFLFTVLQAWRRNVVVCPLERGQDPPSVPVPPPSCCHLKTTSATTGPARAITFTADQLAADADNIVATMGLRPEWPNLGVISLAHSYGFSSLVLPLLLHGIPLISAPSPLPEVVRQAAAGEPALTLPAVPALWHVWHEAGAISNNIRLAISAGASLPLGLERAVFDRFGLKIHNFYGSSECGGIAYDRADAPRSDGQLAGSAVQGVEVKLNAEECVTVYSQAVGCTYWPQPSENLRAGCFQTGDLAEIGEGLIYLRGRLGELVNVAGRKVSPTAIEGVLRQHSAVWECLVFGVPSDEAGRTETIVACVATAASVGPGELRAFLLDRLPAWQVPREWWFENSLAANPRGKMSRHEWRSRYLERHSALD